MKAVLAVFILCVPMLAQNQPTENQITKTLAACGDFNVDLAVDLDKKTHERVGPEPDQAVVYFIQDTGLTNDLAYPTTKIGLDGKWIGANRKKSYFFFKVDPGEHHFCVTIQSSLVQDEIELSHLTLDAGKIYYFRTRISLGRESAQYLSVEPVDSDQAAFLIELFPLAKSHVKGREKPGRAASSGDSR